MLMASVHCENSSVEYSLQDGHIREFTLSGEVLYRESPPLAVDGWKGRCWRWVLWNKGFFCYDRVGAWSQPMFVEWLDRDMHGPGGSRG